MNLRPTLGVIIGITLIIALGTTSPVPEENAIATTTLTDQEATRASPAVTGDNVYVVWWTNKTANNNQEVMFRASTDGGITFSDKINLSNTTNADSTRAEIDSDANNVVVTWWETNQTSNAPVMRISNDFGETFGPTLVLATNGTLGEAEAAEEEEGE